MLEEADLQLRSQLSSSNGPGAIHLNGARQSSADRSMSVSSSQDGEDHQDLEDDISSVMQVRGEHCPPVSLDREVADLKNSFIYVSHQLTRIMKTLNVAPCPCTPCQARHRQMNGIKQQVGLPSSNQLTSDQVQEDTGVGHVFPGPTQQQIQALNQLTKRPPVPLGQTYSTHQGGGKILAGPAEKKMVAEYARIHGAVAAAKKFGVPPPVSTYYQRKDSNSSILHAHGQLGQSMSQFNAMNQMSQQSTPTTPTVPINLSGSPGPSSEGEGDNDRNGGPPILQPATPNQTQPSSVPQSPLFPPHMMEMMKMNAAHSTGSPGFLRGRGRGRPKLIGDELDADLVDYMVHYKKNEPHQHLTASAALQVARSYILEKAPGLLEEQGGHVKLKLTWAMKLVSRIAERQKEIELGLPAGSLSNMGRVHLNNLPGGHFMADMMAQNIISQHMMIGMNGSGSNGVNGTIKSERGHSQENEEPLTGAPEILNVKELPFNFLTDLLASANNEGVIEGQLPDDDDDEKETSAGDMEMLSN